MLRHLSCHFRHLNPDDLVRPARSVLLRKSDTELTSDSLEYAVACVEDDHRLGPQTCGTLAPTAYPTRTCSASSALPCRSRS